jgi:hypothetical protein
MDELAYKSSNTRKANQFSWKSIHNTIYTEAKLNIAYLHIYNVYVKLIIL